MFLILEKLTRKLPSLYLYHNELHHNRVIGIGSYDEKLVLRRDGLGQVEDSVN